MCIVGLLGVLEYTIIQKKVFFKERVLEYFFSGVNISLSRLTKILFFFSF